MIKKGIILGGGMGSRLRPMTLAVNKHLLAVYDKPMIYYPLTTLLELGVQEIILITHPQDYDRYQSLLGEGERFGITLNYIIQEGQQNLAKNLMLCEKAIGSDPFCLILGDNFFHAGELVEEVGQALEKLKGALIFTYLVSNPDQFGVLVCDENNTPIRIEEKPQTLISSLAITGLYFFTADVFTLAQNNPAYQITEMHNYYLAQQRLSTQKFFGQWYDLGNPSSLLSAANYTYKQQQENQLIGSPEWVAWQKRYITESQFLSSIELFKQSLYGKILLEFFKRQ